MFFSLYVLSSDTSIIVTRPSDMKPTPFSLARSCSYLTPFRSDLPNTRGLDVGAPAQQSVEATGHNFFMPQPVQDAKVYYLQYSLEVHPVPLVVEAGYEARE